MEIDPTPNVTNTVQSRQAQMMQVAQSLEAQFLSEMLKSAGVGQTPSAFGGGSGEDQFASFMRDEQAKQMTQAGGIGLAQALYEAMIVRSHDTARD